MVVQLCMRYLLWEFQRDSTDRSRVTGKTIYKLSVYKVSENGFFCKTKGVSDQQSRLEGQHFFVAIPLFYLRGWFYFSLLWKFSEKKADQCPSTFFDPKMSVYILPYNVKLVRKNKTHNAENSNGSITFYALSTVRVAAIFDESFSSYGQNNIQIVRLQSEWKCVFCKTKRVSGQKGGLEGQNAFCHFVAIPLFYLPGWFYFCLLWKFSEKKAD